MEKSETKNIAARKIQFQLKLNWLEKMRGILTANDVKDTLRVALPENFGGTGHEWSPEHLFLSSISSCFMTTFLVLAEKKKLPISNFECYAEGQVSWLDGSYKFTSISIYPKIFIQNAEWADKVNDLMKRAEKYCLISNSINTPITYKGEVLVDRKRSALQINSSPVTHIL